MAEVHLMFFTPVVLDSDITSVLELLQAGGQFLAVTGSPAKVAAFAKSVEISNAGRIRHTTTNSSSSTIFVESYD